MILIDNGSTNSFVDKQVAEEIKLPFVHIPITTVSVADGKKIDCGFKSPGFVWRIQSQCFTFDVRILRLGL